jgi:hypothetical protein
MRVEGVLCGAKAKHTGGPCKKHAIPGKTRCKYHGGMSTGWKTPEGRANGIKAMVEGRRRWVEKMKLEGKRFACGLPKGSTFRGNQYQRVKNLGEVPKLDLKKEQSLIRYNAIKLSQLTKEIRNATR